MSHRYSPWVHAVKFVYPMIPYKFIVALHSLQILNQGKIAERVFAKIHSATLHESPSYKGSDLVKAGVLYEVKSGTFVYDICNKLWGLAIGNLLGKNADVFLFFLVDEVANRCWLGNIPKHELKGKKNVKMYLSNKDNRNLTKKCYFEKYFTEYTFK